MAVTSGFFNSVSGDRLYNADQMSQYFMGLISNGVVANLGDALQVVASSGMTVNVGSGRAYYNGKWLYNDAALPVQISAASAALPRYTAIVVRLDVTNRTMTIATKDGTPASTPVKPTAERSASVCEMILAQIYVAAGASSITQANITDTRADTTVCGWVTGLIDQVDTSTLFAQWQNAYETYYNETTAAFNEFMEHLTQELGVDTYIEHVFSQEITEVTNNTSKYLNLATLIDGGFSENDIVVFHRNRLYGRKDQQWSYAYWPSGGLRGIEILFTPATGNVFSVDVYRSVIGIRPTT